MLSLFVFYYTYYNHAQKKIKKPKVDRYDVSAPQRLFLLDDREVISVKMEDPCNAVEFRDATLAWEKARSLTVKQNLPPNKLGGMKRVLRREKLSLYISTEDSKGNQEGPNAQSLLSNMEQESPQSTISSTQSMRPPLHKTLHRIDLRIKRVTTHMTWIKDVMVNLFYLR